jgi:TonB family protein
VVDTNGRVDMSTFKVLKSDHDAFTAAVRNALPSMRFFPARVADHKIKQMVTMPFTFLLVGVEQKPRAITAPATEALRIEGERIEYVAGGSYVRPTSLSPSNGPPVYPAQLRAANIEGQVVASFVVRANGTPDMSTFEIEKSDHPAFALAVRDAVPSMKFKPATGARGAPIASRMRMPFTFSLSK